MWGFGPPFPMASLDEARANLAFLLPRLRERWVAWCALPERRDG